MERQSMEYDLVIVGAGPAGLAAAIRAKQAATERGREIGVCVLEKGSEVGAHILSGAVFEPRALDELLPDWRASDSPLTTPAVEDRFMFLTARRAVRLPHPPQTSNRGNYVVSLGNLCRWLAGRAEALGVEIYPGFAAAQVLYDDQGVVQGVVTGDSGIGRDGRNKDTFAPGIELRARHTFLAEGCRGSLAKTLIERFALGADAEPQTYALGVKELWEVDGSRHRAGRVTHTIGWPLDRATYGGSFVYHLEDNQVAVGFVVGLDYENPYLDPFEEMQRFKTHPAIRPMLEGGRRVAYGARTINEGGLQAIPKLVFPGGALIGCSAGFVNVPRIKGTHNAMKTGMLAAEAAFQAIKDGSEGGDELSAYPDTFKASWVYKELYRARNVRPALSKFGIALGTFYAGLDMWLNSLGLGFLVPWTFGHHPDHEALQKAADHQPIDYAKPDGEITFDKLSSVFVSNINHAEDQPCHLTLKNPDVPVDVNLALYDGPEARFCPAGVYEFIDEDAGSGGDDGAPRLQINAQNCVHCKTCDIKDATQNINWVVPEGGGGPNYPNM